MMLFQSFLQDRRGSIAIESGASFFPFWLMILLIACLSLWTLQRLSIRQAVDNIATKAIDCNYDQIRATNDLQNSFFAKNGTIQITRGTPSYVTLTVTDGFWGSQNAISSLVSETNYCISK